MPLKEKRMLDSAAEFDPAAKINSQPNDLRSFLSWAGENFTERTVLKIKRHDVLESLTYGEFRDRCLEFATGLRTLGLRQGDRFALLAENSPEWLITFFAVTSLGGIIVPIDPGLTITEIDNLLQFCAPSLLACSSLVHPKLETLISQASYLRHVILLDPQNEAWQGGKNHAYASLLKPIDLPEVPLKPEDPAALVFTSGTTGNPKGVTLSHQNLTAEAFTTSSFVPTLESDRVLFMLPLFHIYTLCTMLSAISVGATNVLLLQLKPMEIFGALLENAITMIVGVPRLYELLYRELAERLPNPSAPELPAPLKENLRRFICGGGKLPLEVAQFFSKMGILVQEGYGLTETTGCVTVNPMEKIKLVSVGKVLPGTQLKILEANGEGIGEIAFSGSTVFSGYYKNPEMSRIALQDSWFRTGDLGFVDPEGYLFITGRKKDMIVLASGKNVYPEEVESLYGKSPLIKQIGIAARVKNDKEEVFAVIVPELGKFSEAELERRELIEAKVREEIARISRDLSPHQRISGMHLSFEELHCTRIGKIKRHELAALISRVTQVDPAKSPAPLTEIHGEAERAVFALLEKRFPNHSLSLHSHLELDLGIDSLGRTELISSLEKIFQVCMPDEAVVKLQTVGDLAHLVQSHLLGSEAKTPDAAALQAGLWGEDGIPQRLDFSKAGQEKRLQWLVGKSGVRLEHLPRSTVDPSLLKGNIEHFIGMAQVPVGMAGPLKIDGEMARGEFYVPLATTEGALVASVTRGMMAITRSGGARACVLEDQVMRAPVFLFERGKQAEEFIAWLKANFEAIKAVAESTTRVGKLKQLEYFPLGRRASVRFIYSSGDASGQNMVTMATDAACEFIQKQQPVLGLQGYFLDANLSGDKKMSMVNFLSTRGKKVYADVVLKRELLLHYLHTTPEELSSFHKEGILGSLQAGIWGVNAHYANMIAAIYIATGQDVACVHEASTGITVAELTQAGDLYMSVTLPNLIIATVGGGTGKGTQRECLELMDCFGAGKVNKLAEIIAATVLAGEISIAGAHAAKDFAQAHNNLGRNRPAGS